MRILPAVFVVAAAAVAQNVPAPERYHDVRAAIAALVDGGETPSIAIAVLDDGNVVWAEGFGLANVENETPATADTIYRLASISKPFTATAIMQLVERGLVDLDAPVNDYLGEAKLRAYRGTADQITVRRLLNHTAGLPTHWNFFYEPETPPSRDESIRRFGFATLEPGTWTNYSNFAFGILDHVIARLGNKSYRDWLVTELCDPLKLNHTDVGVRPGAEAHAAVGYRKVSGNWQAVKDYGFDHDGASAVRSSANDLMHFARLQLEGGEVDGTRVLKEELAIAMRRPMAQDAGSQYGAAWLRADVRGHAMLRHSGGMPGVSTQLLVCPEQDFAVTVLTNSSNRRPTNRALKAILDARFGAVEDGWRTAIGTAEPVRVRGRFRGQIAHPNGPIPVDLAFGFVEGIRIGDGQGGGFHREEGALRLSCRQEFPVGHGNATEAELLFDLTRDGDALRGVCYATVDGVCRVPFWVELDRQERKKKDTLRVVTYNVLVGFRDSEVGRFLPGCQREQRISAWLAAQRPDVVAFQEMNGFDAERLRRAAAAWGHPHVAMLKENGYPVALTSSQPITVIDRHLDGMHHGMLHARTHDTDFVVVHFRPHPGIDFKLGECKRALACYEKALAAGKQAIVLGDFNSIAGADVDHFSAAARQRYDKWRYLVENDRPAEVAMTPLLDAGAVDVLLATASLPPELPLPRIDFVLASPELAARCTAGRWLCDPGQLRLSDHPPVVADFAIGANRK